MEGRPAGEAVAPLGDTEEAKGGVDAAVVGGGPRRALMAAGRTSVEDNMAELSEFGSVLAICSANSVSSMSTSISSSS